MIDGGAAPPEPEGFGNPPLSNSAHNWTLEGAQAPSGVGPSCTVYPAGELVELRLCPAGESGQPPVGGGRRRAVGTVQSWASRRRLGQKLATLDQQSIPVLGTLTIPAWACPSRDALGGALEAIRHRFMRRYPEGAVVIKREHHKSGVPHYHLLAWLNDGRALPDQIADLRRWLQVAWSEVLGVRSRVAIEHPRNCRAVHHYVSGYLWRGKGYQLDAQGIDWGRWWWIWNPAGLPAGDPVTVQAPGIYWPMHRAARRLGKLGKRSRTSQPTARFLTARPAEWARLARFYAGQSVARQGPLQRPQGAS